MSIKRKSGIVVSDRMKNVRIVEVNRQILHTRYNKVVNYTKRYAVYDNAFETKLGDKVRIQETKPLSKTTNWCVVKIIKRERLWETKPRDSTLIDL